MKHGPIMHKCDYHIGIPPDKQSVRMLHGGIHYSCYMPYQKSPGCLLVEPKNTWIDQCRHSKNVVGLRFGIACLPPSSVPLIRIRCKEGCGLNNCSDSKQELTFWFIRIWTAACELLRAHDGQ